MNKDWKEAKADLLTLIPIEKYDCPGIYCIKVNNRILYIGKSTNMRNRLASHLYHILALDDKSNKYIILNYLQGSFPIEFDVLAYCSKEEISEQEALLIHKYQPLLNYQIPKIENPRSFEINKIARTISPFEVLQKIR